MKYLLDTNAISALMRGSGRVVERLQAVSRSEVGVPQPVFAEIAYGIARLPRSKKKDRLRARLELLKAELTRAEWTDSVSEAFGALKAALEKKGTRVDDFDAAIAAHALSCDAVLVTADMTHMTRVPGLVVEDWSRD